MSWPFSLIDRILRPSARRSFEAAGGGRRWQTTPAMQAPQTEALAARGTIMQRARAASVNNPTAARGLETWVGALAGRPVQAMPQHPVTGLRRALSDDFEAVVNPLLVQVVRGVVRDGEAFLRLVSDEDGRTRLQLLPPEQIDPTLSQDLGGGRRIIAGVELDASDRPVAYHVLPEVPGSAFVSYAPPVRVPAADILHIFAPILPGQVRGLSWLAPILLKLNELDRTSDAMLAAVKTQSLLTGFVTDPGGEGGGFAGDGQGGAVQASLEPGSAGMSSATPITRSARRGSGGARPPDGGAPLRPPPPAPRFPRPRSPAAPRRGRREYRPVPRRRGTAEAACRRGAASSRCPGCRSGGWVRRS